MALSDGTIILKSDGAISLNPDGSIIVAKTTLTNPDCDCCPGTYCDGTACEYCGAHTPATFSIVFASVAFATACQACTTSGSMKVLAATVNNVTFPLAQDATNACLWSYEDGGGASHIDVAFYSSSDCTGTPTHADTLRINLRKTNATTFTVEVLAIGADDNVTLYTDTLTVAANACYGTLNSTNDQTAFSCPAQGAFFGGGVAGKDGTATITPCAICSACQDTTWVGANCSHTYRITVGNPPPVPAADYPCPAPDAFGTFDLAYEASTGTWNSAASGTPRWQLKCIDWETYTTMCPGTPPFVWYLWWDPIGTGLGGIDFISCAQTCCPPENGWLVARSDCSAQPTLTVTKL